MEAPSEKPGFLDELKRRRVIRVGLVYVGVAYVVIEAADLIFPRLQLPEWTVSLVIGLAVLGFPLALVLAWAFELTPDGLRPTPPTTEGESAVWISPRAVTIAALLLLTGAALGWLVRPGADTASSPAASDGA
ncbi:MAG: adenylyl cyclase, partial [Gemmatimonadota bacterium]|nr:adenylyl cyclase [Gemmatimonadota bacterium]